MFEMEVDEKMEMFLEEGKGFGVEDFLFSKEFFFG